MPAVFVLPKELLHLLQLAKVHQALTTLEVAVMYLLFCQRLLQLLSCLA